MKKNKLLFFIVLFSLLLKELIASPKIFLETPKARLYKDFSGEAYYSNKRPYTDYGLSFSFLPRLQLDFIYRDLDNSSLAIEDNKIVNLKLELLKENSTFPSIVFGLDDIWGNANYSSKYLAFTKNINYFDLTLGYAIGRLGGESLSKHNDSMDYIKNSSYSNGEFFANIEFLAKEDLSFYLEYNPIDYEKDKKNPFYTNSSYSKPSSHLNYGLRYDFNRDFSSVLSYERGNSLNISLVYNFSFNDKSKKSLDLDIEKSYENENTKYIEINKNSFYDLKEVNNLASKTFNDDKKEYLNLTLDKNKKTEKNIVINKNEYQRFNDLALSKTYMKDALIVSKNIPKKIKKRQKKKVKLDFSLIPKSKNYLTEEKNPITTKNGLLADLDFIFNSQYKINTSVYLPVYSNTNKLKNNDVLRYDNKEKPILNTLYTSYSKSFENQKYINFDFGYLDEKYLAFNVEASKILLNESFAFSAQYQKAYSRKLNSLGIEDNISLDAKFLNIYYMSSKIKNTHLGLKVGEFLYGDKGIRLDLSRTFNNYILGFYYSKTNLNNEENDRGFYLKIPFDKSYFKNKKRLKNIEFISIKNKKGEFIEMSTSLFNSLASENNLQIIKKKIDLLYID